VSFIVFAFSLFVSYQDKQFGLRGKSRVAPANRYMQMAFEEARAACERGEVPIGAVVVRNDAIVGRAGNRTRELHDVTAHAEIAAIRAAADLLGSERLTDADLYVTLEPCTMCAAAISFARIRRLYYGAADPKGGAVESGVRFYASPTCHHAPDVYSGIGETESAELLRRFFQDRRD
jgi:tRNA(adenine34) deaminase